ERTVTEVDQDSIHFDAPLTCALDVNYGGGTIERWNTDRRIRNVGIEDVQLISDYDQQNLKDEQHAWHGIITNDVKNAWIRRVSFQHFVGGAVLVDLGSINVTVQDCASLQPIGERGGYRRHSFFTQGQQTLFLRCWAEQGRHDFSVGQCSAGPNAFVHCFAKDAIGDSGPLESWANGVLYDNVRIDGHDLNVTNRWNNPPKAGWTAANCVLWQCQASQIQCDSPPTAYNWTVGFWATPAGNGVMTGLSDFVNPLSLYHQQLAERTDRENAKQIEPFLLNPVGATNPTLSEAADFVANSNSPAATLLDLIRQHWNRERSPLQSNVPLFEEKSPPSLSKKYPVKRMEIHNGWILVDSKLKTGDHLTPTWWRGSIQPDSAMSFGSSISRYAPGRMGTGLTDDLDSVANLMRQHNFASYNHHYGLWYDRRRDDHLMVRRATAEVAPPFYEQPFARTGQGTAWDGLSLYDLTKWNTWYWQRLRHLADRCDQHGLMLFHENYFQHNILEAGAHWADSPWRPANNVNQTPFPEPAPYVGDKRIFLAHRFYDISQPVLRDLHRNYIRQCLSNFAENQNVIQLTSAEFSGPLEFVEFWIDTIVQWEQETGRNVTVGLSCPKNVQDAILDDPKRRKAVDLIDIRYWTYTDNKELFAPEGGRNLAPRQHVRQLRPKSTSFSSIVRSVREYRMRFPQTPVTYYADMYCRSDRNGWAVLMGGGSLPNLMSLADELSTEIIQMTPDTSLSLGHGQYALSNETKSYLVYSSERPNSTELTLPAMRRYEFSLVNQITGQLQLPFRPVNHDSITLPTETTVVFVRAID
ncbi:MAG: hypothetical protein KDA87_03980, partial [Planctomycetales bacterium]|nr:hypothetical protein [Planctomycetales bacterium]